MENIIIKKAILHILDNYQEMPVLSTNELDKDKDINDFLERHISKVLSDADLKKAYFNLEDNLVLNKCKEISQNLDLFTQISIELANGLFSIMKQNPDIPQADVIFAIYEYREVDYLAMLKLNYRNSYIHFVSYTDAGNVNQLIKQKTTLPGDSQKVDECVIVDLSSLELKLLEKQYEICEKKERYLSKIFLKCNSQLSLKQKIKILDKTASKISKEHLIEDFKTVSKLKSCLAESIEESNEIKVDMVADKVFGENTSLKKAYVEEVQKAGLVENTVKLPEAVNAGKKFMTQKLKTDSGIEINFPAHFYDNQDVMEFINNPDGTISILIKNVGKVVNK